MTGPNSWLSPDVMHALGWTLIHSLWQCAGLAALAMLAMVFLRRPAVRYLVGVGALALMLASPVATFFLMRKPAAPVQALPPLRAVAATQAAPLAVLRETYPAVLANRAIGTIAQAPRGLPDILPWLVAAWACGVTLFSLRFAGGFLLLEHRRRQSAAPGARILAMCQELQRALGMTRAIHYLECAWIETPAVIGWLRPAVLLPVFALTGLSEEQFRAVIAHELAHIRRHDWLVNLFQILAETLLFYHPALWWLNRRIRIERELCCDEIAVSLTGSRLEYARALAQMAEWKNVSLLAMAANRGPLSQRILHVLGRPGAGQRAAGITGSALFLTAAVAAANLLFGIAYPVQMAHAQASVKAALVSSQAAIAHATGQAIPAAHPAPAPASDETPAPDKTESEKLDVVPPDLSRLAAIRSLPTPALPAAAPSDQSASASSVAVMAPDDQPGATTPDLSAGSAQAGLSAPHPPDFDPNKPYAKMTCTNNTVTGRVTSSTTIQMPGFGCAKLGIGTAAGGATVSDTAAFSFKPGPCKNPAGAITSLRAWARYCPDTAGLTMTVQLANPGDASKMPLGKLVTLKGDFLVITQNKVSYLLVQNARVLYVDPLDRQAEENPPPQIASTSAASEPAAFTPHTVQARPVFAPDIAATGPATVTSCRNSSVFGRVISPMAITMQGFTCFQAANDGSAAGPRDVSLGQCPLASTADAHKAGCDWDVTLNVHLADPGDVDRMRAGQLVRLGGNFTLIQRGQKQYLAVQNARILFRDVFYGRGGSDIPPFFSGSSSPGGGGDPGISASTPSPFGQGGVHF